MRTPVALRVALGLIFLTQFAEAETPTGAAAEPSAAPAPSADADPSPVPASSTPTPSTGQPAPANGVPGDAAPTPADDSGPVVVPEEPEQVALEPIPSAHDTLGGHFVVGASLGARWPFGSLEDGKKQRDFLGTGLALNLDLGYGLSRNVVLGAWGEFDAHSSPSGCAACSGKSFAGGPFVRYHIVQGTRFDPWGALALGVRSTSVDSRTATDHYFGVEFLKLSLGGDWYPTSNFGFGPYVSFDMGTHNSAVHSALGTGLRFTLDFPGK